MAKYTYIKTTILIFPINGGFRMKITDIIINDAVTVSCEIFPPKAGQELSGTREIVRQLGELRPSFISVTYGAGGTESGNTVDIAKEVQTSGNTTALAHLTCVTADKKKINSVLGELKANGIKNILALRGDIPQGSDFPKSTQYAHASDLMEDIRNFGGFCIGGACYPEGHPEAGTLDKDIQNLKFKVENGCEFLTTQMFFDNNVLYSYMFRLLKAGIDIPVIAGIMPVTNAKQIPRIAALSGATLPPRFKAIIDRFSENPNAMKQAGIAYATEQIIDLIANGVSHVHIYTMNKPDIAASIINNLSEIFER